MSRQGTVYHSVKGFIKRETDKAILFECQEVSGSLVAEVKSEWFPTSQIQKIFRQPKNSQEMDEILAAEWILQKKELV